MKRILFLAPLLLVSCQDTNKSSETTRRPKPVRAAKPATPLNKLLGALPEYQCPSLTESDRDWISHNIDETWSKVTKLFPMLQPSSRGRVMTQTFLADRYYMGAANHHVTWYSPHKEGADRVKVVNAKGLRNLILGVIDMRDGEPTYGHLVLYQIVLGGDVGCKILAVDFGLLSQ